MKLARAVRKHIRKWWMLVTADKDLVRIQGNNPGYCILSGSERIRNQVIAMPVMFTGLLGWEHDYSRSTLTFPNIQQARKKTIIAKYYIEVME